MALALQTDTVHIWMHRVGDVDPGYADILAPEEHRRSERFAFQRDRRTYLATRIMVRHLLSYYADVAPEDWRFQSNAYGRPGIRSPAVEQPLHFNVSHTSTRVVCAVARHAGIGIDVESRLPDNFRAIADDNFSPREIAWLGKARDDLARKKRFLQLWTLKEAYIKAVGIGMTMPLTQFSVLPEDEQWARLTESPRRAASMQWAFRYWMLEEDCAMAIALNTPEGIRPRCLTRQWTL